MLIKQKGKWVGQGYDMMIMVATVHTLVYSLHSVCVATQGSWSKDELGSERVSRADLMMVLQDLDYILIKAGYDENQDEVRSAFHTPLLDSYLLFASLMN